ncbi:autotransporter outer membrane beta-barrel domain-containing protein [Hyphomicrobium facile]|uniref:Outer membrane autotransporter barrel domain-containing protein n=1 Tax=Hyphomicrobium facile TaxID=51670 RepID=A0A1I7NIB6_9HYPH|nr:autotransporter domain-containing protein [Hyphomicrobium facile]SFV34389.1 outer membrane autotransporter barrel domain-containing protein [Hyphomicrobium facile]
MDRIRSGAFALSGGLCVRAALLGLAVCSFASHASAADRTYTTLNFGDYSTFLTGIRGNTIVGNYAMPNSSATGGLLYDIPSGTFTAFPISTDDGVNYPGAISSSPYGPSFGSLDGILRTVGSYQTSESAPYDLSYLYDGALAPGANLTTLIYPSTQMNPTLFTIAHSTFGDTVVGNYDTQLATGNAFIYSISTGTYVTNNFPGAISTTAYGVYGNLIAGGYSPVGVGNGLGLDRGYIYNMTTDTWKTYNHPDAVITHFEGITGGGRAGTYNLVSDWVDIDGNVHAAVLHIAANGDETWIELGVGDYLTSANSMYGEQVIGVYVDDDHKINGYVVNLPEFYDPIRNSTIIETTTADSPALSGVEGDDIVNDGIILTSGANAPGIRSDTYGVVTNNGTISVTGPESAGVEMNGDYGTLLNGGTILAEPGGYAIRTGSTASGSAIANAGIINGKVSVTGALPARFENSGWMGITATGAGTTHSISGTFVQTSSGTLALRVGQENDALNITGAARIAGTEFTVFDAAGLRNHYTLMTASEGLSGTFEKFTQIGLGRYISTDLAYTLNDVTLNLSSEITSFDDLSANQTAVGRTLDNAFNSNGRLPGHLAAIYGLTDRQLPGALNALSGEVYASEHSVLIDQAFYSRQAVLSRLRQFGGADSGGADGALAHVGPASMSNLGGPDRGEGFNAANQAAGIPPTGPATTFWTQAFGARGSIDGNGNASSARSNLAGVLTGADIQFDGNWRAGLALGYSSSNTQVSAQRSAADVDGGLIAFYGGTHYGALNLRLGATVGFNSIDTTRTVAFQGFVDRTHANYSASTAQAFGELGYATSWGAVALEPFTNLAWVHLDSAAFTEAGGDAALAGASSSGDVGYSSLGVRAAGNYSLSNGMAFVPHVSVAWQYAFGDLAPETSLALASVSGSNFSVSGVPLARNAALIDAGADLRISTDAKIGVSYTGQLAKDARDNAIAGNVRLKF